MAKVILSIGYMRILLPDDSGVQTVMRTLSKGVECHDRLYRDDDPHVEVGEPIEVGLKMVPRDVVFKQAKDVDPTKPMPPGVVIAGKVAGRTVPRLGHG